MTSITIPENLPGILKNYVKAAIRSQPEDIIKWSADYFKATDEQFIPVVGIDENISTYKQDRTLFRILAFQLGTTIGTKERIEEVWSDFSLDFNLLEQIYKIGKFHTERVDMTEFLGITFGHWTKSLKETVLVCCEAFCKCLATDGYFLHVDVACKLYMFLAKLDCSLPDNVTDKIDDGQRRHYDGVDSDKDNVSDQVPSTMKTSYSLDVAYPSQNQQLKNSGVVSTSLESVFACPMTTADYRKGEKTESAADDNDHVATGYHVPGIGPRVPEVLVQEVMEYFQKCATENGGCVYDFDIENDQCPRFEATDDKI